MLRSAARESALTLQEMNPYVRVSALPGDVDDAAAAGYKCLQGYQVVILAGGSLQQMLAIDDACQAQGTAFYSVVSRGPAGYFFANLHQHQCTPAVSCINSATLSRDMTAARLA